MNKKHFSIGLLSLAFVTLAAYAADNIHSKLTIWQASDGIVYETPTIKGSSAKLTRGDGVVWIRVNTTGLPAGAYTNWWVIFNNPDACNADGCGGDDFFPGGEYNAAVSPSVLFATGGVVTDNGVGHFRAHLEENDTSGEVLFGPGLTTAEGAEIHYIVRYHGPAGAGDVLTAQTTTFGGGCSNAPNPYPIFPCYDPQSTGFPRP
jgi:hypothetical protein